MTQTGSPRVDQVLSYYDSVSLVPKASGWAAWFDNTHTAVCGDIVSCELKTADCSASYTTGNLVIADTGEVTVKQNIDAGYEDIVCISCKNSKPVGDV